MEYVNLPLSFVLVVPLNVDEISLINVHGRIRSSIGKLYPKV